ncbi:hypothetical protein SAMN05216282_105159 [Cryobacterium psychrotolerans]|uniref:Uncharacterized protein n=1 Tax=Cryobacterium psychrotolerans TaxID=386301 RepID=A0A1G9BGK1_9MICO|nr:hypothetical protein SAMN05216282_105159 [Cryobacterium psychrotolerans]
MASTAGNRRHIGARPGGVGERFRLARARSAPEPLAIGHVSRETCGTVRVRDPGLMELVRGLLPWETLSDGSANLHKVVMIAPAGESSWGSVPAPKSHRFGSAWAAWTRRRPQMSSGVLMFHVKRTLPHNGDRPKDQNYRHAGVLVKSLRPPWANHPARPHTADRGTRNSGWLRHEKHSKQPASSTAETVGSEDVSRETCGLSLRAGLGPGRSSAAPTPASVCRSGAELRLIWRFSPRQERSCGSKASSLRSRARPGRRGCG